jgi:hypothetical protein
MATYTVKATQLQVGDKFSDDSFVEEVFDDGADGVWLATYGPYEDAGYVDPNTKFKITREYDE